MSRVIGSVKWFDSKKGYGFIEISGQNDLFVHFSEIQSDNYKKLYPGEYVEFEIDSESDRPCCLNVTGPNRGKLLIQNEKYRYKVYPNENLSVDSSVDDVVDDAVDSEVESVVDSA